MKTLIVGSGVLGCYHTMRFLEKGVDVTLLARGEKLQRFTRDGIVLRNFYSGQETHITPAVVAAPLEEEYALVMVFVQAPQQLELLPLLESIPGRPCLAFMGNNTKGFQQAAERLGKERVLAGFGMCGGTWRDEVLEYVDSSKPGQKPFNEFVLGAPYEQADPRFEAVCTFLKGMGFVVKSYQPIVAWHLSHAAIVAGLAGALYGCDTDIKRLAKDTDMLRLAVMATKEALQGVRLAGYPVVPGRLQMIRFMPAWVSVRFLVKLLNTQFAEIGLAGHARAARGEMRTLMEDVRNLAHTHGGSTLALDELLPYFRE